jgi:hypothetical protein
MRRSNPHLDRLTEVQLVKDFMLRHDMQGKLCNRGGTNSYVIYRLPFVIEFIDYYIENYLAIYFCDTSGNLVIEGNVALGCSFELGLQNLNELRERDKSLVNDENREIFLSENGRKLGNFYDGLEAIDRLLPLIEAKGGLASMRDGTFDPRFDFSTSVSPMWFGLKDEYLQCIGKAD